MSTVLVLLGALCSIAALVCHIIVLIHAFKNSTTQGLLTLCVPCYNLYYIFTQFEHEKKNLIIAVYLGGGIMGNVLSAIAQNM